MNNQSPNKFDPFNDRLARDIRNSLSKSFIAGLKAGDIAPAREAVAQFGLRATAPVYRDYIAARLQLYSEVLAEARQNSTSEPFFVALILWNKRLFFEVHEVLESIWMPASGLQRRALQGMIQAAGVYIHLEQGNQAAAKKMAVKAHAALKENQQSLPLFSGLEKLLEALQGIVSTGDRIIFTRDQDAKIIQSPHSAAPILKFPENDHGSF